MDDAKHVVITEDDAKTMPQRDTLGTIDNLRPLADVNKPSHHQVITKVTGKPKTDRRKTDSIKSTKCITNHNKPNQTKDRQKENRFNQINQGHNKPNQTKDQPTEGKPIQYKPNQTKAERTISQEGRNDYASNGSGASEVTSEVTSEFVTSEARNTRVLII